MNKSDIEDLIEDYIRANLRIDVRKTSEYGYDAECVNIKLLLNGKEISSDSFSL